MKKLIVSVVVMAITAMGFVAPVFADSPGQLAGGSNLYKVRNVTQNGTYSSSVAATCNDTLKYSVEVSNTQFGALSDVTVTTNLASGALNVSAKNSAGATVTSNGSVQVDLTSGNLQYIAGSTQLYTIGGTLIKTLADGVVGSGVNVGDLGGSTREFVQFQAKVSCPTPPPVKITVCDLTSKQIITINESDFDATKHSKDLNKCAPAEPGSIKVCVIASKEIVTIKENEFDASKYTKDLNVCEEVAGATTSTPTAPTVIAATGPVGTLATMLGLSSLAAAATYIVRSRAATFLAK